MKRKSQVDPKVRLLPPLQRSPKRLSLSKSTVVIHAGGFEDRTMAVADLVMSDVGARAILLDYRPVNPQNRLKDVRDRLQAAGLEIANEDMLTYDRFAPDHFQARLRERLLRSEARAVIVDLSSMSKLAIILVLDVCKRLDLEVSIIYTEAGTYAPSREQFERAKSENQIHRPTLQVYTGVHGVIRVDSLASVAMQGQPTAALVFMSFNDALTQVLLNTVYPGRLFLINGRPPQHSWREAATAWIHDRVRREWEEDNPLDQEAGLDVPLPARTVSTLDYRETVSLLLELYWSLSSNHRILLAPSGSKMQAVACYIAKALHPDIQIEYPSPEGFSKTYSSGVGAQWLVSFGRFSELLRSVSEVERREHLEIPVLT